jgi:hypothetical protein
MLRKIRIALAVTFVALAAVTPVDSASALGFGYGQIGGYERGGYEYSQLLPYIEQDNIFREGP